MFITLVSSLVALPLLIKGFRLSKLTQKKNEVASLVGLPLEETTGIGYFLFCASIIVLPSIPFDVIWFGEPFASNGAIGWLVLLFTSVLTYTFHFIFQEDDIQKEFKKVEPLEETVETFFGKIQSYSKFSFASLFGFSPYVGETRPRKSLKVKQGRERESLIQVAKVFHEAVALETLRESLPSDDKLNETDRLKKGQLKLMIDKKINFLRESREIVRAAVITEEEAYFSEKQQVSIEELRELSLDVQLPYHLVHPTLEELVQIQSNPKVSQHIKEEAKELKKTVEKLLEEKAGTWSEDELARFGLETVKRFHHIN